MTRKPIVLQFMGVTNSQTRLSDTEQQPPPKWGFCFFITGYLNIPTRALCLALLHWHHLAVEEVSRAGAGQARKKGDRSLPLTYNLRNFPISPSMQGLLWCFLVIPCPQRQSYCGYWDARRKRTAISVWVNCLIFSIQKLELMSDSC